MLAIHACCSTPLLHAHAARLVCVRASGLCVRWPLFTAVRGVLMGSAQALTALGAWRSVHETSRQRPLESQVGLGTGARIRDTLPRPAPRRKSRHPRHVREAVKCAQSCVQLSFIRPAT